MLTATLAALAIVVQDNAALRAAPRDSAQQQAVLWQGDSLEVRGRKGDYLQVYDYRRERAGYVRATQVRTPSLQTADAPELLAVVRFLRDTPGAEALGASYAAAYLRAAPAEAIDGEIFAAIGGFADRLARRASARASATATTNATASANKPADAALAAHLEILNHLGLRIASFENDGQMRLCYDGEAFRRVLALPASDSQKAEAALALTQHECVDPALGPVERFAVDGWRADVLERVATQNLSAVTKNRLLMRKAGVWASLAYQRARQANAGASPQEAATRAINALAAIDKSELTDSDRIVYHDAAVRVGASRWAAALLPDKPLKQGALRIQTRSGEPGETCVDLIDNQHERNAPLLTRCTYGIVWPASASSDAQGNALALAVQQLDTWRELWVFHKDADGWRLDVAPPATETPGIGVIEFAGWVPGGKEMLAARDVRSDGRYRLSFEVLNPATLETRKRADKPDNLSSFYRWQSPLWKSGTLTLR